MKYCTVTVNSLQVGFTSEGMIQALELQLYGNAGYSIDLSYGVCVITGTLY